MENIINLVINALSRLLLAKVSSSQITIEDAIGNVSKASLFRWSVNKNSDEIMQQTVQDSDLIMHLLKPHPSLYHSHENSKRVGYKNHTNISKSKKRKRDVSPYNIKKNSRKHIKKNSRKRIKKHSSNSNNVMSGLDSQYVKQKANTLKKNLETILNNNSNSEIIEGVKVLKEKFGNHRAKFREVDKFWNNIENEYMNEELNTEEKGLQLDELRMARVIAQGASKATATVMENVDAKLKSNRKHSLSDTPKRTGEIECETAKKTKTTQDPSTLASSTSCDDETEEQDEQIEIDLVDLKKQLEMEPLIEWKVGNINVTRKFRQYQRSVIDKVISYGLKWSDSYEILAFASIIVLSWPCPYSKFFTNREWDQVTRTNPYVIRHPVIPSSISTVLREVAMMHLMGKESHMQSDESKLSKAVARTFNDLCDIPTHSPTKISEELHCDMLLYPYINSLFFGRLAEYEVRLNRTERVNKLAEDFKGRNQPFTPPLQMKFMTEFPDSPQLKQLLELS
ncbi:hypothetical protein C2G38_2044964 [Gigaspora rosea]|uniref:Uncharacterized protein n=1 Tax=Gigaspora rosea TaxID=44941 RepID=A0A397UGC0_9GLOM|nr:hypothetical protein C2G38_2044964 [Gigaspora rosea]